MRFASTTFKVTTGPEKNGQPSFVELADPDGYVFHLEPSQAARAPLPEMMKRIGGEVVEKMEPR